MSVFMYFFFFFQATDWLIIFLNIYKSCLLQTAPYSELDNINLRKVTSIQGLVMHTIHDRIIKNEPVCSFAQTPLCFQTTSESPELSVRSLIILISTRSLYVTLHDEQKQVAAR